MFNIKDKNSISWFPFYKIHGLVGFPPTYLNLDFVYNNLIFLTHSSKNYSEDCMSQRPLLFVSALIPWSFFQLILCCGFLVFFFVFFCFQKRMAALFPEGNSHLFQVSSKTLEMCKNSRKYINAENCLIRTSVLCLY